MFLREWWTKRAKRKALRQYATVVRRRLHELYGPAKTYTPNRVKRAVEESDASSQYILYAYAMYCTPDSFGEAAAAAGLAPTVLPSITAAKEEIMDLSDGGITLDSSSDGVFHVDSSWLGSGSDGGYGGGDSGGGDFGGGDGGGGGDGDF